MMTHRHVSLGLLLAAVAIVGPLASGQQAEAPKQAAKEDQVSAPKLHPKPPEPISPGTLQASIERGVRFLLSNQNKDGSWGSAGKTKQLNIIAEVGSQHAFRTAVTALCVSSLVEAGGNLPDVRQSIERGEAFLFEELPKVRRDTPMLIYNVWAHGYGIQALVHLYHWHPKEDTKTRQKIVELIRDQYDRLSRYESAEGGWGYYDFDAGSQRPAASSTSFMNAAVLEALYEAKEIGVPPPEKVTRRAIEATKLQRLPDFSYLYGTYLWQAPTMGINRPGGSLGRSQACNLALRLWGDKAVTDDVIKTWLDRLITRNGWLDMGRKRPIPHESHFFVAGYFYYFGHYYATLCMEQLKPEDRPFYQDHLGKILLAVQEKDGSWWDYPLYNYGQFWGTPMALMSLERCRKVAGTEGK